MTDQNPPAGQTPDDSVPNEPVLGDPEHEGSRPGGGTVADASGPSTLPPAAPKRATGATVPPPKAAKGGTAGPGGVSAESGDQWHDVDDPVSKWWVILIVAVFAVIFAWALLLGSNGLLSGGDDNEPAATASPTIAPLPSLATEAPDVAPTAESSSEPTAAPTQSSPEPTATPTEGPAATGTPGASASAGPTSGAAGTSTPPAAVPTLEASATEGFATTPPASPGS